MSFSLVWTVNVLEAGCWIALLLSLALWGSWWANRHRTDALIAVGLAVAAAIIRLASSERLPMISGYGDFTLLRDIMLLHRDGLDKLLGVAGSAHRMLYWLVFKVTGPSLDVAWGITVTTAALTTLPVYGLGRMLTNSPWGGILAGLIYACFPPAILFANGVASEPTAALLVTSALAMFVLITRSYRPLTAAAFVLCMLLFVQVRGEGPALAVFVVLALALIAARYGNLQMLARYWPTALAGTLLVIPFVMLMRANSDPGQVDELLGFFIHSLSLMTAIGIGALLLDKLAHGNDPIARPARWTWNLLMLWLAYRLLKNMLNLNQGAISLVAQGQVHPDYPFITFYGLLPTPTLGFFNSPGGFPFFMFLLIIASFFFFSSRNRSKSGFISFILALCIFSFDSVIFNRATGNVILESFRYHMPLAGLLAALVAAGALKVIFALSSPNHSWARPVGLLVALALAVSPLITHRALYTDTMHNLQHEYKFVSSMVDQVRKTELIVVPDFPIWVNGSPCEGTSIEERYKADQFISSLAMLQGKSVRVLKFREHARSLAAMNRDVVMYLGHNCFMVNEPYEIHPWCQWIPSVPGVELVSQSTNPNRRFSGGGFEVLGPRAPQLTAAWYKVKPEAMRQIVLTIARTSPQWSTPAQEIRPFPEAPPYWSPLMCPPRPHR